MLPGFCTTHYLFKKFSHLSPLPAFCVCACTASSRFSCVPVCIFFVTSGNDSKPFGLESQPQVEDSNAVRLWDKKLAHFLCVRLELGFKIHVTYWACGFIVPEYYYYILGYRVKGYIINFLKR